MTTANPIVAKAGGLQSQDDQGSAGVVIYCEPLATRDLEFSGFINDGVGYLLIRAATFARLETALSCCAT
jgi:hypothetical protein